DRAPLAANKQYRTRGYLRRDGHGRAFASGEPGRSGVVEVGGVLWRVLDEHVADREWIDLFPPPTLDPDAISLEWADSAAANGVSRESATHVIRHCWLRYKERSPHGAPHADDFRTLFVGVDEAGE